MKDAAGKAKAMTGRAKARNARPGHALPQRPKAVSKAGIRACGASWRAIKTHTTTETLAFPRRSAVAADAFNEARARGFPDPLTVAGGSAGIAASSMTRRTCFPFNPSGHMTWREGHLRTVDGVVNEN
jgi:hypothetical protein